MTDQATGGDARALTASQNESRTPSFTLSARRLAGSEACLNCGTQLAGPFCYYCGQPDRNFLRFFPVLLREFLEDFIDLDSRFTRTLKPLLFHPGRLTRDYLEGRRFRYTPPMRLYLFSSIGFFLIAALLSGSAISDGAQVRVSQGPGAGIYVGADTEEEREQVREALEKLPPGVRPQVEQAQAEAAAADPDEEPVLQFNDRPWDRETNPIAISWLPASINDWLNDEAERSPLKMKQIEENPRIFFDQVFDILPGTMFVLLPVVALLFKFWYLFTGRYYIEHLIFCLHNHAFIFTNLILALLVGLLTDWFGTLEATWPADVAGWLRIAIYAWIPVYLLVSLRHVYRQNWFLTVFKYGAIGISYVVLLGLVTGMVALISFLLL